MILQIDGWFGSGKGVLWLLLDSHPEIFCSPIHDYSYGAFLSQSDDHEWVQTKHVEILRKVLARSQYYKFEKVFWDGFMSFDFATDVTLKLPYSIDFYAFDYRFMMALKSMQTWTIDTIVHELYQSVYIEIMKDIKTIEVPKHFAIMSNPYFIDDYINIPTIYHNGKSIHVRRKLEDILAVRSNRKPKPEDFKSKYHYSGPFQQRIESGEVEKILTYYNRYDSLCIQQPEVFTTVAFEDLIFNTEATMRRIADYLQIHWHPNLLKPTWQGTELIHNGKSYIGQVNDEASHLLTEEEIEVIQTRMKILMENQTQILS